ncbi:PBECR4 domain-containing protein [Bifidobacterium breve]|uniref:PBECR4 domain-containing protein n=1 Tax=Bifidobacterium breve TaxID=1685 RepID=UPI003D045974
MKENRFDPEDSIRAIHACTPVYLERLLGRHALFVPGDGSVSMETLYKADNFMHLCGAHYENISPKDFWEMALKSYLTPDELLPNRTCVATRTNQDTTASTSRSPPRKPDMKPSRFEWRALILLANYQV